MLDLDKANAWTERSEALQRAARRRIRARKAVALLLATITGFFVFALWPATTPQPARATTTPHGFIIKKAEQIVELMQRRTETPPPINDGVEAEDCMMCWYLLIMACRINPIFCTK